jgi:hypothetical protein
LFVFYLHIQAKIAELKATIDRFKTELSRLQPGNPPGSNLSRQRKRKRQKKVKKDYEAATRRGQQPKTKQPYTPKWPKRRIRDQMTPHLQRISCILEEVQLSPLDKTSNAAPVKRFGVNSVDKFRAAHLITEYAGIIMAKLDAKEKNLSPSHFCSTDFHTVLVGIKDPAELPFYPLSSLGSFVNSCTSDNLEEVNAYLVVVRAVYVTPRVLIVAQRDIESNEKIIINYGRLELHVNAPHIN